MISEVNCTDSGDFMFSRGIPQSRPITRNTVSNTRSSTGETPMGGIFASPSTFGSAGLSVCLVVSAAGLDAV